MAEALLTFAGEQILSQLLSLTAESIGRAWGLEKELKSLDGTLKSIRSMLVDVDETKVTPESVKLWLEKLENVSYDAIDALDDFDYEILRRKVEIGNSLGKRVKDFFSRTNPVAYRLGLAYKVKAINESLQQIQIEAGAIGLVVSIGSPRLHKFPLIELDRIRETDALLGDTQVIGRHDDVSKLVEFLFSSGSDRVYSVVSVVGMGGLGKTTIAKAVFNDERIKRHFPSLIWVCVSDNFDPKKFLREMLESLKQTTCQIDNLSTILQNLKESLQGKRYLLVLDDVWNEETKLYETLKSHLTKISSGLGNKIMVTTRKDKVAKFMESVLIHNLRKLSDDWCWSIFKERAFSGNNENSEDRPEKEAIGKVIASRCGGVPLAARVLGGMMRSKLKIEDWIAVEKSNIWSSIDANKEIIPVLRLSFDNLPSSSLKQCFAYCSLFPKDFPLKKAELIQMWMAHGFLQTSGHLLSNLEQCQMEDIGDQFFCILLSNSLLQDTEEDGLGNVTRCKMHDLVHDLAASVFKPRISTLQVEGENDTSKIRHLSLLSCTESSASSSSTSHFKDVVKNLHSLFSTFDVFKQSSLTLKNLRLLNLREADIKELPESIGRLKHLKYLDLSYNPIEKLPHFLSKLYHLQTLNLVGCWELVSFPMDMRNLVSLRHLTLDFRVTHMPFEIGHLTCLQTLSVFKIRNDKGYRVEELGSLNQLRGRIQIMDLQNIGSKADAEKAKLAYKTELSKVEFEWDLRIGEQGETNDEDVLEGLQPHSNIKDLAIAGFNGLRFPQWISVLCNLEKIELRDCKKCQTLPSLGQLPCLRDLFIEGPNDVKYIGSEFYGRVGQSTEGAEELKKRRILDSFFPSLRRFYMHGMPNLVEWIEPEQSSFPKLEYLRIRRCPKLRSTPNSLRKLLL